MDRAGKLLRRLKLSGRFLDPADLARAAWPQAVGRRIASHARPIALERGRLIVEVEDPLWKHQLETLSPQILAKLADIAGRENVSAIEFRPGIPRRAPQREETPRVSQDEADGIRDPILRRLYKDSRRRAAG